MDTNFKKYGKLYPNLLEGTYVPPKELGPIEIEGTLNHEVTYTIEAEGEILDDRRVVPISIMSVTWRGIDLLRHLDVNEILQLQRIVFSRLTDEEKGTWVGYKPKIT